MKQIAKKTIRAIIVIAVIVAAIIGVKAFLDKKKASAPVSYDSVAVRKGSIISTVTATGTIEPIIQVEVGTQVSGIIEKIYVDFNSEVKKGQIIAELEKVTLQAELASSRASLEANKAEYEYQMKNYERLKRLYDKEMISDSEYEQAEYQYKLAKSAYEKSKSDISRVEKNLGYATIYSPIDGVVLNRAVDEGQTVAASFSTPELFTIANDLRNMRVIADVDEADIGVVEEGQKVTFTVDAFPGEIFNGSVTQVRLQPTTTSNVVTYEVVVDAPNPDLKLKPGLTANITIITTEKNDILLVPTKALRFTPAFAQQQEDGKIDKILWVRKGAELVPVSVQAGSTDGIYTQVIGENIKEGDEVITNVSTGLSINKSEEKASNPFMPGPPGRNNNNKSTKK